MFLLVLLISLIRKFDQISEDGPRYCILRSAASLGGLGPPEAGARNCVLREAKVRCLDWIIFGLPPTRYSSGPVSQIGRCLSACLPNFGLSRLCVSVTLIPPGLRAKWRATSCKVQSVVCI